MDTPVIVKVPDIGDFHDVPVIEVHVKPGDAVKPEDSLITLESEKATMDVPSPAAGVIKDIQVAVGNKVSEGTAILTIEAAQGAPAAKDEQRSAPSEPGATPAAAAARTPVAEQPATPAKPPPPSGTAEPSITDFRPTEAEPTSAPWQLRMPSPAEIVAANEGAKPHASPSVRRFARELGVDVAALEGTGPKGRILREDVQSFVKQALSGRTAVTPAASAGAALNLPPWPQVDFAKFGPIERQPLSRIKKLSGPSLARNWVMIPAVTYHEDADITDLEAFRVQVNKESAPAHVKVTVLAFIIKAVAVALKHHPELNASLDGADLVLKRYWHIGFAADTPNGLVVPVLRDADAKGVLDIARETAELSAKARAGKLMPSEMQGASFTVSSIGGIGSTYFSPIVNAPEVAILGVSKSQTKPVWDGKQFMPRLILPLSLSADHRVVDGAQAARFNALLAKLLGDFRRALL